GQFSRFLPCMLTLLVAVGSSKCASDFGSKVLRNIFEFTKMRTSRGSKTAYLSVCGVINDPVVYLQSQPKSVSFGHPYRYPEQIQLQLWR
ncbi:hypothetical protein HI914_05684, partial [Erysiphe necator]